MLTRLGRLINWEKSSRQPSLQKEFIGYVVITGSMDGYPMIKVPQPAPAGRSYQRRNGRPIKTKPPPPDASLTGWTAVPDGKQAAGYWDKQVVQMTSNYREF